MTILHSLVIGTGGVDVAYTALRVSVGAFYGICGIHKLLRKEDHTHLVEALEADIGHGVKWLQWFVPAVEFSAGSAVFLGLLTPLAAMGILAISVVACVTDGRKRIPDWSPTDGADYVADYLYLPEVLYAVMLGLVIAVGSGPYGLDTIVSRFI